MLVAAMAVMIVLAMLGPAQAGVVPALNVTGAAVIAHDVSSGFQHPTFILPTTVLGPHWGPFYIGGTGIAVTTDGHAGAVVVLGTYVAQGYINGWFRGLVAQVGVRKGGIDFSGPTGYYFGLGVSR